MDDSEKQALREELTALNIAMARECLKLWVAAAPRHDQEPCEQCQKPAYLCDCDLDEIKELLRWLKLDVVDMLLDGASATLTRAQLAGKLTGLASMPKREGLERLRRWRRALAAPKSSTGLLFRLIQAYGEKRPKGKRVQVVSATLPRRCYRRLK